MDAAAALGAPVVAPPSLRALSAGLATGSSALLMLGLQPLLLGALADERRLDADGIGAAATLELLALGVTIGLLSAWVRPAHLRWVNALAALALAIADLLGTQAQGAEFVISRGLAGVASGVLVWVAVALITRTRRPDRVSGIFLSVQTLAQAALAAILPMTLMPSLGANGGLAALAALAAAAACASIWLPSDLAALPAPAETGGRTPMIAYGGLGYVFLSMAAVVGLWVFVEQIGTLAHISARIAGLAVAGALAAQVTGSFIATLLSGRLSTAPLLVIVGLANVGLVWVLGGATEPAAYLVSVLLFGFLWLFAMPFQTRLLLDLDPSRRAAMLISSAQLLGMAAGPMITSAFATSTSLSGTLTADALLFAGSALFVAVLGLVWRRQ